MVKFNIRWALFLAVFVLSSVYFFVFGESGILERMNLESTKKAIEEKIDALRVENKDLSGRLERYRQGDYSANDFLESGYIKPGEKVIMFGGPGDKNVALKKEEREAERYKGLLPYFRILWVSVSVVIVVGLFLYNRKFKNRESP